MSENGHQEITSDKNLFRIGEVSRLTATKPFVLRYWETEFPTLQPVKSPKGHRLYRREDVETVLLIKRLLYDEGFTIAGARRHLRDISEGTPESASAVFDQAKRETAHPAAQPEFSTNISRKVLIDLRDSLRAFLTLLETE
jgi:DNA-binding transcriptional MerR regulator